MNLTCPKCNNKLVWRNTISFNKIKCANCGYSMYKAYKKPFLQTAIILFLGVFFGFILEEFLPYFNTGYLMIFMQFIVFCVDILIFVFGFPLYFKIGITILKTDIKK